MQTNNAKELLNSLEEMGMGRPLTPQELADYYSVSINTVYYWNSLEGFPSFKAGRHLRFELEKVQIYFEEGATNNDLACQKFDLKVEPIPSTRSLKIKDVRRAGLQKKGGKHGYR